MTCGCVGYHFFQRMERKQSFGVVLLDELNNKRKEQLKVANRDITCNKHDEIGVPNSIGKRFTRSEGCCGPDIFLIRCKELNSGVKDVMLRGHITGYVSVIARCLIGAERT